MHTKITFSAVRTFLFNDERDLKLLLLRRAQGKTFGGQEEPPGGKIKLAEDPKIAAQREILEECGYLIPQTHLRYLGCRYFQAREGGIGVEYFFCAHKQSNKIILPRADHESFRWLPLQDLKVADINCETRKFFMGNLNLIFNNIPQEVQMPLSSQVVGLINDLNGDCHALRARNDNAPKLRAEGVAGTQKYVSARIPEKAKMGILKSEGYSSFSKVASELKCEGHTESCLTEAEILKRVNEHCCFWMCKKTYLLEFCKQA